jgi:hypothetical protein
MTRFPPLAIRSFAELHRHEPEILKRIAEMPNGGNLFMLHPLRLFSDIDVKLTVELEAQLVRRFPELSGLSPIPYDALNASRAPQNIRFHIRGLFRTKSR